MCSQDNSSLSFLQSSHIALLDALMRAQVSAVLTVPRVVRVVRYVHTGVSYTCTYI